MNLKALPASIRVLAVIPARGGSKGIPKKNIAMLHGKPLIYYTIREAIKAKSLDAVIVSTDSEEIAAVCRDLGADVPFLRPQELATDTSRDIDFLQHALQWVSEHRGWKPEIITFLPPTSPSRTAHDIDEAIAYMDHTQADSVRTMVYPQHFNPYKMWKNAGSDGRVEPLFPMVSQGLPRQELDTYYMPVAIAYVTKASCIEAGRIWGDDVRMMSFPLSRYTDIDVPEDLNEAERVMSDYNLL